MLQYIHKIKGRKNMKFLIKNYNKDEDNDREILATVLFEVQTIKEAQEKMAEFVTKIKDNWQTNLKNGKTIGETAAIVVNLYHIIDGLDIENYRNGNHEEFISKFDSHTRNVLNPTDKPIVAFLNDLMLKQESEADCMAEIDWYFDFTDDTSPKLYLRKASAILVTCTSKTRKKTSMKKHLEQKCRLRRQLTTSGIYH